MEEKETEQARDKGWRFVRATLALSLGAFLLSAGEFAWDRWEKKLNEEAARKAWAEEFDRGWHERFDARTAEMVAGFRQLGFDTAKLERECYGEMDPPKVDRCVGTLREMVRKLEEEPKEEQ